MRTIFTVLVISTLLIFSVSSQTLSPDEKRIVDYIDQHNGDAVSFLESIVNLESPTEDLAGVKNVGVVFKKEFEALGLTAKWIDMGLSRLDTRCGRSLARAAVHACARRASRARRRARPRRRAAHAFPRRLTARARPRNRRARIP